MGADVEGNAAAAELEALAWQINVDSTISFVHIEHTLLSIAKVGGVLHLAKSINLLDLLSRLIDDNVATHQGFTVGVMGRFRAEVFKIIVSKKLVKSVITAHNNLH